MKKKGVVPILLVVLAVSTLGLTAFSVQAVATIKSSNNQMAGLNSTVSSLKNDMATMRTLTSGLSPGQGTSVTGLVSLVEPAVVRIDVSGPGFIGVGSGFIVDESGYVINNEHVIDGASAIKVTLSSGESYAAKVNAADSKRDIALIKMTSTRTDFPVIELGSANDAEVGAGLLIGGFPLGLELSGPPTFTQGIVSAIRTIDGLQYIQTDAPINPGNSGGPVIDMQGTLIGVCVAAVTTDQGTAAQGLGLVIPVGDLLAFIDSGQVSCSNCHYSS
jgi:S1-C subfamily serine protease